MTPEEQITLDEAVAILEITDLDSVTEDQLTKLRRKAQVRWHPDKILHTNPSEETLERYQRNFRLIDQAISVVQAYLQGEVHGDAYAEDFEEERARTYEAPQDVIRRNAASMQEGLRGVWERVKQTGYKMQEEVATVARGLRFADMLRADLEDKIPSICVVSLASFLVAAVIPFFVLAILALVFPPIIIAALVFVALDVLACLVGALPMARFWLPDEMINVVDWFVSLGLKVHMGMIKSGDEKDGFGMIIIALLIHFVGNLFHWLIVKPIYLAAAALLGDRGFKDTTTTTRYFAGAAEWYIEQLMSKDLAEMTNDELFDLSHIWGELKDAPMAKAA